ncbi:MAG: hypothetical protein M5R40_14360 [Anaerolineae bacterium]|nr:hypothetical protein [Anaerolineae bacterium]
MRPARLRIADRARLAIIGVFLLTLPLLSWGPGTNVAGGDGHVIYAYVRSLLIDGDLHLENEYRHHWPVAGLYGRLREAGTDAIIHAVDPDQPAYKDPESRTNPNYGLPPVLRTPTGHVANQHAVGPALLWAPFFLLGHGVAVGVNLLGGAVPLDGYSLPYTIAVGFGTALMALGAMLLAYAMLLRYVRRRAAVWAVILIYLASPLVVYAIQTPIAAHGPAAFVCALFLFLGLRVRDGEAGGAPRQAPPPPLAQLRRLGRGRRPDAHRALRVGDAPGAGRPAGAEPPRPARRCGRARARARLRRVRGGTRCWRAAADDGRRGALRRALGHVLPGLRGGGRRAGGRQPGGPRTGGTCSGQRTRGCSPGTRFCWPRRPACAGSGRATGCWRRRCCWRWPGASTWSAVGITGTAWWASGSASSSIAPPRSWSAWACCWRSWRDASAGASWPGPAWRWRPGTSACSCSTALG